MKIKKKLALLITAVMLVISINVSPVFVQAAEEESAQTINSDKSGNTSGTVQLKGHVHENWTYEAAENKLTAKCYDYSNCNKSVELTLSASNQNYSGSAVSPASFGDTTATSAWTTNVNPALPTIEYYRVTTKGATTGGTKVTTDDGKPKDIGYYYAQATVGTAENTATVVKAFEIKKITPTLSSISATPISHGAKLSESTITGTAKNEETDVEGTWSFSETDKDKEPAVSDSNATSYDVVFTPIDTTTYNTATGTVTTTDKLGQTITADNVTATYGDTGKSINASCTGDGTLSYVIKSGAATDVVDVDASTGALTIKKVGTTTITVTASETDTYSVATKDVEIKVAATTYVLQFDPQGGSQVGDIEVEMDQTASLPIPNRASYEFVGWFTDSNNPAIQYTNDTVIIASTTLYAKWEYIQTNEPDQEKCIIQFNTNGADEIPNVEVPAYTKIEIPLITKSGYILKGWSKESENNNVLYIERTMMVTTSDTLHAQWKKKSSSSSNDSSSSSTPNTSSSSTPTKTETPKADPVIIDGKKYEIGTQKVTGEKTTFTVDQDQFTSNIEKATSDSEIVIPVTSSTDTVKAQLNLQNVKDMSDKSILLKVENKAVTYTVPTGAIDTEKVAKELGEESLKDIPVEIVLEKADKEIIEQAENAVKAQKGEVVGTPMTFEFKASAHGKEVKIDSFNTYVKNSLVVSEKEAEEITTAVIIMPDGSVRHVPTAVHMKDNKYLADVNSKTNGTYVLIKNNVSYSDAKGKWYEGVANELGSRMITSCLDKENTNTIQGEKAITREEFAALLVNALGLPQTSNAADTFSDVTGSSYTAEIGAAYEYGIINGVTETTFMPNKTITRQEAMAMLQRAAKIAELTGKDGNMASFKDASKVSDWAQEAVVFNVGNGLIIGSNGEIKPQDTITRAESMTVTLRLLQKSNLIDVRTEA